MTGMLILGLVYIAGFILSLAYILKPNHKRLLITNSIVLLVSVAVLGLSFVFYEGYDLLAMFLMCCGGVFVYYLLVSCIALFAGLVKKSNVLISAGATGLVLSLILFMVLWNIWPESR